MTLCPAPTQVKRTILWFRLEHLNDWRNQREVNTGNLIPTADDSIAQCTFTPQVGRAASRRTVSTYDRDTESYRHKHAIDATEGAESHQDDQIEPLQPLPATFFRPPPPLPDAVPIGYVDAVARLRRSAATHEQRFRGFPEHLRAANNKNTKEKAQPSTILRLPGEAEAINIWLLPTKA